MVWSCASKLVTSVSYVQELMSFDCQNFNELVPTGPYFGKEQIDFMKLNGDAHEVSLECP